MVATTERWFRWVENHGDVEDYPAVAVLAALVAALTGKPADAERWARAAEQGAVVANLPDRSQSLKPWLALLRALLCRDGAAQMQADAELATATMAAGSFWRTAATVYLGLAHLMADDSDKADVLFAAGIAEGLASGVTVGPCVALAERSLLAITNGEWDSGERIWTRPGCWRVTPILKITRRSPFCTPPPRGSRSIRETGCEPARNWPGRSVFARL
jgi:hypothetical protein